MGRLGRARGVQGALWVSPLTDFPDRFAELKEIYLYRQGDWRRFEIEWARIISGRPVLKLAVVNNREDAARLTNTELAVPREQLVKLPDATFYVFDLIGCQVIDHDSGEVLGEVLDVQRYPANDVYVIEDKRGRKVLFPAVAKFVTGIDTDGKKITVRKAGLFEEPEPESGP